jgi:hypothetical protein
VSFGWSSRFDVAESLDVRASVLGHATEKWAAPPARRRLMVPTAQEQLELIKGERAVVDKLEEARERI